MSNKGNSPDNAGCEGVFGRIKNECFYTMILKVIVLKSSRIIWINTNTGTTMKEKT